LKSLLVPIITSPIMSFVGGDDSRQLAILEKYTRETVEERIASEASSKQKMNDSMHYLLEARDPETGRRFTRAELNHEAVVLISAGSDTTSTTLSSTVFYLLHNPEALEKATKEVRSRFASSKDICGDVVHDLTYLRSCIDEALRLCPPVPSLLPREVIAGGLTIEGQYVPKVPL
jgi:cytochrome P450